METANKKTCFLCKESKPGSLFRKDPQKKDGMASRCKACINKPKVVIDRSKITEKKCVDCIEVKSVSNFHIANIKRWKYTSRCKPCMAKYKKNRYWANHEVELDKMTASRVKPENVLQRKEYYKKNKSEYIERYRKYMADDEKKAEKLKKSKEQYRKNTDKIRERHKRNYEKPGNMEKLRQRHHIRKLTDIEYIIKRRLRFRLRHIIKAVARDNFKRISSAELLGCSMTFFKKHIENKFTEGMSWDRISEIHIDHKKPCAKFDLTKESEQRLCFHYSNLQPLWKLDNLRKGSFYQEEKQTA